MPVTAATVVIVTATIAMVIIVTAAATIILTATAAVVVVAIAATIIVVPITAAVIVTVATVTVAATVIVVAVTTAVIVVTVTTAVVVVAVTAVTATATTRLGFATLEARRLGREDVCTATVARPVAWTLAAAAATATALIARVAWISTRDHNASRDLAPAVLPLVVVLGSRRAITRVAERDERKSLVLTVGEWELHVLELAKLPEVITEIIFPHIKRQSSEKKLASFRIRGGGCVHSSAHGAH